MHDVATGFMVPTTADENGGFDATFGTTINIINGGLECGTGNDSTKATMRGHYYEDFLEYFELPVEDGLGCANQSSSFPSGGYGDVHAYF